MHDINTWKCRTEIPHGEAINSTSMLNIVQIVFTQWNKPCWSVPRDVLSVLHGIPDSHLTPEDHAQHSVPHYGNELSRFFKISSWLFVWLLPLEGASYLVNVCCKVLHRMYLACMPKSSWPTEINCLFIWTTKRVH